MNIVLAVHHFPPRYTGGAEWEAFNTAVALRARGHRVNVLCVERIDRGSAPPQNLTWVDDDYAGLPVRRLTFDLSSAPDPERWEYDNAWIGEHLRGFLIQHQADLFHLMGGYLLTGRTLFAAREAGVPTVVSLMDFWFLCRRLSLLRSDGRLSTLPIDPVTCARCLGEESRRYRWLGQLAPGLADAYWRSQAGRIHLVEERLAFLLKALQSADAIISRSQFVRQVFVEAGLAPERLTFIRQGRDFPGLELQAHAPADRLRVGYLGQIAAHKGVHVLVQAARQLVDAALDVRIYGNLDAFPQYVTGLRRAMGGDPRLQLAGPYQGEPALRAVLQDLDVVVVPSLWYENSPNVILEAFAHGVPVVVSDLGGMAELVEDGVDGLRFAPGDAADLARCLGRLVAELGLLARLRAGIKPIKSVAQEMDELEGVYRQVTADQRLRREVA